MSYHRIAGRLYDRPLLLLPSAAQTIEGFVRSRSRKGGDFVSSETGAASVEAFAQTPAAGGGMEIHGARSSRFVGSTPLDASGRPMPFRRTQDGVGIITIVGELVNRGAWIGASSGLVSYEGINHQLSSAAADPMTKSILLDIESPGGEAVGAFECAAMVRKAAATKPVVAVVNAMAASAGYAIASGATRIVTTPTGLSGSIGVVMMHLDYSKMLAEVGVEPTFIFAGDHKVDGNAYEPLPDAVRAHFQSEIDAFYGLFIETVAMGRGARLTAERARATQARMLMGEKARRAGLADSVASFEEAVAMAAELGRARSTGRQAGAGTTTTAQSRKDLAGPHGSGVGAMMPDIDPSASISAVAAFFGDRATAHTFAVETQPAGSAPAACLDPHAAFRTEVAEVIALCAEAAALGMAVDASDMITSGVKPNAIRQRLTEQKAELARACAVVSIGSSRPSLGPERELPRPTESPLLQEVRRSREATLAAHTLRQSPHRGGR